MTNGCHRSAAKRSPGRSVPQMGRVVICAVLVLVLVGIALAGDPAAVAARISDGAFAMLAALNARGGAPSSDAAGAVAIFAGDAQTLSRALAAGDRAGAASAMGALQSDRGAVDRAVTANPKLLDSGAWNRIKSDLDDLSKQVASAPPPAPARAAPTMPSAAPVAGATGPPGSIAASGPAPASSTAPPQVVIESRTAEGSSIRVKGYLEGTGLKRGGIYDGTHELRPFKVGGVAGEERINFDIGVEQPAPGVVLRVYDAVGRMAEAPIATDAVAAAAAGAAAGGDGDTANAPEIPPLSGSRPPSAGEAPTTESGVEVFRNSTGAGGVGGANTAEIPTHGKPRKSPSKRRTMGSHLGDVQITITSATMIDAVPTFELAGQIKGHGLTHAGIYVDRRLVRPIAIAFGSDVTTFDEKFVTNGGNVTIRAYSVGDEYVESSIDLSNAIASLGEGAGAAPLPGGTIMGGAMPGYQPEVMVQIQAVGPITRNLYVVSGVISGRNLSAAGLYQNGMLMQRIAVNGGGIGGMIGGLIPGATRSVSFNVRFNPQAGPATIRAFDASGGFNEQPIVVTGMSPYGGVNPYGMNPYGSPYGYNPYSPYGTNPYGVNPYGNYGARPNPYAGGTFGAPPVSPYLPPTNPFGSPPASSW